MFSGYISTNNLYVSIESLLFYVTSLFVHSYQLFMVRKKLFFKAYGLLEADTKVHYLKYEVVWKVSDLAYNRRETWDKRPLGRDPDRS